MSVRKKFPADVTVLKQLTQEQAVTIAELEQLLGKEKEESTRQKGYYATAQKGLTEIQTLMEEVHGLIDSIPGVLPRQTVVPAANDWDRDKKRDNSIMLRLASLMGALNSSRG